MVRLTKKILKKLYNILSKCNWIKGIIHKIIINNWKKNGRPIPPPHIVKAEILKQYAYKFSTEIFIETGTYRGDMILEMKTFFNQIYSIELDKNLYLRAKKKFDNTTNIYILQGDSCMVLPDLLNKIEKKCLFWLDAHYSGGITTRGNLDTPIMLELKSVFSHKIKDHIILIDDARCFNGSHNYPTIQDLRDFVKKERPDNWVFEIRDDIIRIHKYISDNKY